MPGQVDAGEQRMETKEETEEADKEEKDKEVQMESNGRLMWRNNYKTIIIDIYMIVIVMDSLISSWGLKK